MNVNVKIFCVNNSYALSVILCPNMFCNLDSSSARNKKNGREPKSSTVQLTIKKPN